MKTLTLSRTARTFELKLHDTSDARRSERIAIADVNVVDGVVLVMVAGLPANRGENQQLTLAEIERRLHVVAPFSFVENDRSSASAEIVVLRKAISFTAYSSTKIFLRELLKLEAALERERIDLDVDELLDKYGGEL